MSEVELVVTEARIWARGADTHWDAPPSVVLGSNGFDLVVGQPLTPPTQVGSVVQFVPAAAMALPPRTPSVVDAMGAVFASVLENLRVAAPCARMTVICPTEWGAARRGVLEEAARRWTSEVVFEGIAVRSVASDEGTSHSRRTLVLEFGTLTTTASAVIRSHRGVHVESCEHDPALALAEITEESPAFDALRGLVTRLLEGGPIDLAQVVGIADPTKLGLLGAAIEQAAGAAVELRSVAGNDLLRGRRPGPSHRQEMPPATAPTEWMRPLRDRAAAEQPRYSTARFAVVAVAALVVVALVVIGAVIVSGRGDDAATAAPSTETASTSVAPSPAATSAESAPEAFGRIRFRVPPGWRVAPAPESARARVDLVPETGARQRITVMQTPLTAGSGYEQVAAKLEVQMAQRPPGVLTDLERDVVFGSRSSLAYSEHPEDGSTVRWHVLLESGIQVSVGCQYVGEGWSQLETLCTNFGDSVRVVP
ncbi:type VII secretion-associated protein [Streptomyces gardneri]|uniref:type VII secretion-associated protein n=1 Tax=Nocardia TaxID=1817 RepID=UPI00135C7B76|nr:MULTISPECIES: type VII secretion-associated protein [Nocardia]MBF6167363.1 type VII secretion-associated protein [Streptomyces gardneri]MBF6204551.1 type VII secretion-associated protein [Streptomyces gardneri]UAK33124.1 type VII secretion-associated protein [Nocardia asteroides]